jgi:rhodanese-related sulfurtransferase
MIELTKTRRLSFATILFILMIVIGFLTFSQPEHKYALSTKDMLTQLNNPENSIQAGELTNSDLLFVDLRQTYDFHKGTIINAINVPVSDILNKDVIAMFDEWEKESKTVVLFSDDQQSTSAPWMLIKQLGYNNFKVLAGGYNHLKQIQSGNSQKFQVYKPEQPTLDYAKFIKESSGGEVIVPKTEPTKLLPERRKKKTVTEGGC